MAKIIRWGAWLLSWVILGWILSTRRELCVRKDDSFFSTVSAVNVILDQTASLWTCPHAPSAQIISPELRTPSNFLNCDCFYNHAKSGHSRPYIFVFGFSEKISFWGEDEKLSVLMPSRLGMWTCPQICPKLFLDYTDRVRLCVIDGIFLGSAWTQLLHRYLPFRQFSSIR